MLGGLRGFDSYLGKKFLPVAADSGRFFGAEAMAQTQKRRRRGANGVLELVLSDRPLRGARPEANLVAFALQALPQHLPVPANGFGPLTRTLLRRLLKRPAQLHLTENAFALHLLLERA